LRPHAWQDGKDPAVLARYRRLGQPPIPATCRHGASSEVHLRSPVRSSLRPARPDGSGLPWTSPLCFRTLRYLTLAGVRDSLDTGWVVATSHVHSNWSDIASLSTAGSILRPHPAAYHFPADWLPLCARRQPCRGRRSTGNQPGQAPAPPVPSVQPSSAAISAGMPSINAMLHAGGGG
jgi:hypothetical protein